MSAAAALKAAPRARPAPFVPLYVSRERIILLRGVLFNVCLREIHDSIFGEPVPGVAVRFALAPGAEIRSKHADLPAVFSGYWPRDGA